MGALQSMLVAGGASALAGGANAYVQSQAVKGQSRYQAGALRENARLSERGATDALARGTEAETRHLRDVGLLVGRQRASFAGQGVDISQGTPAELQRQAMEFGLDDARTIKVNALREAFGYRSQAQGLRTQAKLTQLAGRTQSRAMLLGGALGAVRDVANTASLYNALQPPAPGIGPQTQVQANQIARAFPPHFGIGRFR